MKITTWAARNKVTMADPEMVDSNPGMDADSEWARSADHYRCVLKHKRRMMTVHFSMGSALCREPSIEEVLDSLASEASGTQDSFEEWASEFGYDTDSRSAERTYQTVKAQTDRLRQLLGEDLLEELLYETERL